MSGRLPAPRPVSGLCAATSPSGPPYRTPGAESRNEHDRLELVGSHRTTPGQKASNTYRVSRRTPYPELSHTIPPATGAGADRGASGGNTIDVLKSRLVSNCHSSSPVEVEKARNEPSLDAENTAPAIAVTAADCAALHPRPDPVYVGGWEV